MESLLHDIIALLVAWGPWLVFLVTMAETAVFVGLLLPAEATVLVAAFFAHQGRFSVWAVLAATFFGGLVGDQVGYALGRFGGARVAARRGLVGRIWARYEAAAALLFRRHAVIAISLARAISFIRTLMPWFAGMSGVPYRRFLVYDLIGVAVWATGSVVAGYLAGASWRIVAGAFGTLGGLVLLGLITALLVGALRKKDRMLLAEAEEPE